MLLHEAAVEHVQPPLGVDPVRDQPGEAAQRPGVVIAGLLGAVGVVPNPGVRRLTAVDRLDIASLDRVEEAFRERLDIGLGCHRGSLR
jgi:hypothetical protein